MYRWMIIDGTYTIPDCTNALSHIHEKYELCIMPLGLHRRVSIEGENNSGDYAISRVCRRLHDLRHWMKIDGET